jgi:threonyl-tRNA synthetase
MVAVEKGDNSNESVEELVNSVIKISEDVNAKNIVLYPYAHLSSNLGSPSLAIEIINKAKDKLSKDYNVISAPFGYYKEFELKVKGHPLSELSREIMVKGDEEIADLSDEERKRMLKEISKSKLDTSKLADNDHRIIGKNLDLWSFNAVAPGMVFWHPKGLHIKNKLIEYWREMHRKDYVEISTPQIMDRKLWEISGHWKLYNENNFKTKYEGRDFLVKPMNCPGGMLVYKTSPKSYKDLPLRVGELGNVHRVELSGVLSGLFRVIQFTQDDAHIFCTEKQLQNEIKGVVELIQNLVLKQFGFKEYRFTLSTRSEEKKDKYLGDDSVWDLSEGAIKNTLKSMNVPFDIEPGEAKFYGPSLDVQIKDSLGREWQCATIQLDMLLPARFEVKYNDENGDEQTPIMLHRVVLGSLERFIGVYTEHISGKFPVWLSPNQIKVLTLNDEVNEYAKNVYQTLLDAGFEVELDDRNITMGKKAREAQMQKYNYLVTIGSQEIEAGKIAVKARDGDGTLELLELDDFITKLKEEIKARE